jgi:predicted nucleic acid-binding protein
MILLDTNVLSALMNQQPEARVADWLDRQPHTSIWTTSITVFEIRSGLQTMPRGKRRSERIDAFERLLAEIIEHRFAVFDSAAAERAAEIFAERQKRGRPVEMRDTMIAGIVLATHAKLATRNVKHFEDIASSVVNPWEA